MAQAAAQIFNVYGAYTPTKAMVHLRATVSSVTNKYFEVTSSSCVIDATNFSENTNGESTFLVLDVDDLHSTGKGAMEATGIATSLAVSPILDYPFATDVTGTVYVSIKMKTDTSGDAGYGIYLDDELISSGTSNDTPSEYLWIGPVSLTVNDLQEHKLSVRIVTGKLDKIVLSQSGTSMTGDGPAYTESPYLTIHARVHTLDGDNLPSDPLMIYDHKNTITNVLKDGWYGFDLNFLDESYAVAFSDSYALVLVATGSNSKNYVTWDLVAASEYADQPAAYLD